MRLNEIIRNKISSSKEFEFMSFYCSYIIYLFIYSSINIINDTTVDSKSMVKNFLFKLPLDRASRNWFVDNILQKVIIFHQGPEYMLLSLAKTFLYFM